MRFFDLHVRFLFLSLFLFSFFTAAIAQDENVSSELSRSFKKFNVVRISSAQTESLIGRGKVLQLSIDGSSFELNVTPNDLRAENYRAENTGAAGSTPIEGLPVNTFRGKVAGHDDSDVRLTIDANRTTGYFRIGADKYFVEPASKYSSLAAKGESVVYRAEDSLVDRSFACEADVPTRIKMGDRMLSSQNLALATTMRRFEIATEADHEFVNQIGSAAAANAEILSILNMVEGTYSAELNLRIRVTFQHTWTVADPYAGANTNAILTNFLNYWNANYPVSGYARNAAHLFTAKPNTLSLGIAYIGVVCQSRNYSYGLSGYINSAPAKYLITAHELGHNLGAQHADATQNCANTIMNASLSGSTPMTFCAYSQSQINSYVSSSASCLISISDAKRFDFDGDNRADIAVFRPNEGNWYLRQPGGGSSITRWGLEEDVPVTADYDGDGKSDFAVFRRGVWWRYNSGINTIEAISFGLPGDIPVPANFDKDSKADIAVFRPSSSQWYWIKSADSTFNTVNFGLSGDIPLPADFDGDGVADVNVFRPSNGTWYRLNSSNFGFTLYQFGLPGDKPLIADFDGDSISDFAVWRPSTAEWYVTRSSDFTILYASFGLQGDIPAPADFDGDGRSDISVYRPSNGTWYRLNSSDWQYTIIQYGLPGDIPVPSYYIQ